jgi:hypothetical protein
MYHFTPDLDVAKKYAAWAKRRDNVASVIIVQIAIQNSAIEAMRHPHHRNNRNKPNNYHHQRSNAQELTETCVLKFQGPGNSGQRTAVQYVSSSDDAGEAFLEDQARNTKLLSFGESELENWMEEQGNAD